jgi:DNA-binding transcriptional ArsR family regulator
VDAALTLLAAPTRRHILRLVWHQELCAGAIAAQCDVTFGAVSQHLKLLREGGLVSQRRDGKFLFYAAQKGALGPLAKSLETMWADALGRLKQRVEAEQQTQRPSARRRRAPTRKRS